MGHCLGSYAGRCSRGDYVAYRVTNPQGVKSSLGLYVTETDVVAYANAQKSTVHYLQFNQQYGRYNGSVSKEDRENRQEVLANELLIKRGNH